jgi:hypothetical protein
MAAVKLYFEQKVALQNGLDFKMMTLEGPVHPILPFPLFHKHPYDWDISVLPLISLSVTVGRHRFGCG